MILQGDVLQMIRTLADESINCIITSPPYFGLRDYQLPPADWPEVTYAPMAGLPEITIPPMTCCLGLEDNIEAYVGHMVLVWRILWRVLRGDGVGWLNLGDSYSKGGGAQVLQTKKASYGLEGIRAETPGLSSKQLLGIPWRVAFALQADGWYLRSDIIWAKKNPMPESCRDRPTKAHEYLFLLAKSGKYYYDQDAIREPNISANRDREKNNGESAVDTKKRGFGSHCGTYSQGRNRRTVWSISSTPFPGAHFAVMPEALVEPCLLAGCPAQVCVECGEPWVRVVEREAATPGQNVGYNANTKTRNDGERASHWIDMKVKTLHFSPTCQCSASTRPGVVLDPFFGSGTVGVVARKKGRDFIGIELNEDYAEMAGRRLQETQPALFAIT